MNSSRRLLVVYVAGPYRNKSNWKQECNIRRAEALSLEVWRHGMAAICPHANTRFFQYELSDSVWLSGDLAILARCDAMLLTEDWRASEGACKEREFAQQRGIPVYETLRDLIEAYDADEH